MYEVRNGKIAFGKHRSNVFEVHLDGLDLVFILWVIGCDLNESAILGEDEAMRRGRLAETHALMAFTALHNAGVMVAARWWSRLRYGRYSNKANQET